MDTHLDLTALLPPPVRAAAFSGGLTLSRRPSGRASAVAEECVSSEKWRVFMQVRAAEDAEEHDQKHGAVTEGTTGQDVPGSASVWHRKEGGAATS